MIFDLFRLAALVTRRTDGLSHLRSSQAQAVLTRLIAKTGNRFSGKIMRKQ